jgi:hypothetical protein
MQSKMREGGCPLVTISLGQSFVAMFRRASVRAFVLCLVASAVRPSLSQAQAPSGVPVFEITPVSSD